MGADADKVNDLVREGHGHYDRGQIERALTAWEAAFALAPDNGYVGRLVAEARAELRRDTERMEVPESVPDEPSTRRVVSIEVTDEVSKQVIPEGHLGRPAELPKDDEWAAEEVTMPESSAETAQRLARAEAEALAFERDPEGRRITKARAMPAVGDDAGERNRSVTPQVIPQEGAPEGTLSEHDMSTRQIGSGGVATTSSEMPAVDGSGPFASPEPAAAHRTRAAGFVDRCRAEFGRRRIEEASLAAEQALQEGDDAPPPGIAEVIEPARPFFERVFLAHIGPLSGVPATAVGAAEIASRTLDPRSAFFLSRMDGVLSVENLLDISGFGRFDSLRMLSTLLRAGLIRFP